MVVFRQCEEGAKAKQMPWGLGSGSAPLPPPLPPMQTMPRAHTAATPTTGPKPKKSGYVGARLGDDTTEEETEQEEQDQE